MTAAVLATGSHRDNICTLLGLPRRKKALNGQRHNEFIEDEYGLSGLSLPKQQCPADNRETSTGRFAISRRLSGKSPKAKFAASPAKAPQPTARRPAPCPLLPQFFCVWEKKGPTRYFNASNSEIWSPDRIWPWVVYDFRMIEHPSSFFNAVVTLQKPPNSAVFHAHKRGVACFKKERSARNMVENLPEDLRNPARNVCSV
ncbi:hypothetical protein EDF56_101316 [Novosphingobium sp. PhB165]|uniref:hypothetical protein n=1 Tax=Novosphingobium sp. PhB165 TaxID=2485105 RepID=UPI0010DB7734|nr:hypothetical protein [Novosphingobium sp. PhB165]TCM21647.1 hypothetical protein EDF56_101316 [Novosphingobium sp. PhB165]